MIISGLKFWNSALFSLKEKRKEAYANFGGINLSQKQKESEIKKKGGKQGRRK